MLDVAEWQRAAYAINGDVIACSNDALARTDRIWALEKELEMCEDD